MATKKQPDRFLSYAQVAEMLGLSEGTVRNGGAGTDELPRVRLGDRVVFSATAVEEWMAVRTRAAEAERRSARDCLADRADRQRAIQEILQAVERGARYR